MTGPDCHPDCALGTADHPGSRGYRCLDAHGDTLPFPGEAYAGEADEPLDLVRCGGPERIYDDSPEPEGERGPFGFTRATETGRRATNSPPTPNDMDVTPLAPQIEESAGPLLWEGDDN